MRLASNLFRFVVVFFVLLGPCLAQAEVEAYLDGAEPMMIGLQSNIKKFMAEVKPLREQNDIVGLKQLADNYILIWDDGINKLNNLKPPMEADNHYLALRTLFEMQRESNQIMSETLAQRIVLLQEIQKLRDQGATDDEVKEYAISNSLDKEALLQKTSAVKKKMTEADQTLKTEHLRLTKMVAGEEPGEG